VLTLVERGGSARSFHIDSTSIADIAPILRKNISRESKLMTDEAIHYKEVGREFDSHGAVLHSSKECVRYGADVITTNAVLFDLQARHEGRLPTLPREASASVSGGI
jgi:hypothetical protein